MLRVLPFVEKHDICNGSAMHIRETDLAREMVKGGKRGKTPGMRPC